MRIAAHDTISPSAPLTSLPLVIEQRSARLPAALQLMPLTIMMILMAIPFALILGLLAAEIAARTGKDPGENYAAITRETGAPFYARIDAPANAAQKNVLKKLSPEQFGATALAGEKIMAKLTETRQFNKLVARGRERGYLTYSEVNRMLPEGALDAEQLDKVMQFLKNKHRIEVVDDPADAAPAGPNPPPLRVSRR